MIRQRIHIEEYGNWRVDVYYGVTHFNTEEIMDKLWDMGCDGKAAKRAYENMKSGQLNTGFTYSNFHKRQSIMAVGVTKDRAQFLNTLVHELQHLAMHIAQTFYIDPKSEELGYLIGDIAQKTYKVTQQFLCNCKHYE